MGQRLIISEEERSQINKMYGLVNEQKEGDKAPIEQLPKEIQDFVKRYNLSGDFNYSSVDGKIGERFGYNKGNRHSDIAVSDIQTYEKNKGSLSKCQEKGEFFNDTLKSLMSGTTNNQTQQDPRMEDPRMEDRRMQEYCKRNPKDPRCESNSGKKMNRNTAIEKAKELTSQKFPNMEFCGVVKKVHKIIKM